MTSRRRDEGWVTFASVSALVHAVLAVVVASGATPTGQRAPHRDVATRVPPPRLVGTGLTTTGPTTGPARTPRPAEPRPVAVVTLGVSMLMLACGLSLVAIGVESHRLAPSADSEGATVARDSGAVRLLATGIPVASVGLLGVVGGIVWVALDRRRDRRRAAR